MENSLIEKPSPLLSIIIPTKNRQYTCLYAIESALMIDKDDVEIIVQDCSDTDILKTEILTKFGGDARIKYDHTSDFPDMTTNWNRAYDRATGKYQCGIGDDDGILVEIYELAKWADKNEIAAIVNGSSIIYIWPDFKSHFFTGSFVIPKKSDGNIKYLRDHNEMIDSLCEVPSFLFAKLPMVYHCLISKDKIIDKAKAANGKLFHGTSLDVYSSIAFSKFYDTYISVDFPFTMKGSSSKSNSGRFYNKKIQEHFKEYRNHDYGKICPPTPTLETTLLESIEKGLHDINQTKKMENLNIPLFYAKIVAREYRYFKVILSYGKQNFKSLLEWFKFFLYLLKYSIGYFMKDFSRMLLKKASIIFGENNMRSFLFKLRVRPDFVVSDTIIANMPELRKNCSSINYKSIS
jgi:glycosyltransferase involved in cell wall biosynthesis